MSALPPACAEGELVDVACALCGSTERRLRFRDGPFSVVTCAGCDLTYVTPRVPPGRLVETVYGADYWRSPAAKERGYTDYRADAELYRRTFRLRKRLVDRFAPRTGRVLDVGCAAGFFLEVLRDAGWDVLGLEPSAPIRATARERLGADAVLAEPLGEADLAPASFDLVTMWDVLEHLPDPVAALRAARGLLAPGGRLIVETQNVASLAARALGRRWQHYKHAEHLHHFHAGTLERAYREAGLRTLHRTARYGGKLVSPAFVAERAGRVHPVLSTLLAPLARFSRGGLYVNLYDELIAVAAAADEP
jgi:2-polyprenyl-3-methyl-5-hydroxy-6-metoxy-1,4-benzoquinol methylase